MISEILIDKKIHLYDKLKLIIIFALKYENDQQKISELFDILQQNSQVTEESLNLYRYTMKYAGKDQRLGDLFQNKGLLKSAQTFFKRAFKETENIYLQHQPHLVSLIDQINKGKLPEEEYPAINKTMMYNNPRDQPNLIIIFQLGGTTYEEAKEVGIINQKVSYMKKNIVILGGTTIHNSKTFLAEISQLKYGLDTSRINIGPQIISFDKKI